MEAKTYKISAIKSDPSCKPDNHLIGLLNKTAPNSFTSLPMHVQWRNLSEFNQSWGAPKLCGGKWLGNLMHNEVKLFCQKLLNTVLSYKSECVAARAYEPKAWNNTKTRHVWKVKIYNLNGYHSTAYEFTGNKIYFGNKMAEKYN